MHGCVCVHTFSSAFALLRHVEGEPVGASAVRRELVQAEGNKPNKPCAQLKEKEA